MRKISISLLAAVLCLTCAISMSAQSDNVLRNPQVSKASFAITPPLRDLVKNQPTAVAVRIPPGPAGSASESCPATAVSEEHQLRCHSRRRCAERQPACHYSDRSARLAGCRYRLLRLQRSGCSDRRQPVDRRHPDRAVGQRSVCRVRSERQQPPVQRPALRGRQRSVRRPAALRRPPTAATSSLSGTRLPIAG